MNHENTPHNPDPSDPNNSEDKSEPEAAPDRVPSTSGATPRLQLKTVQVPGLPDLIQIPDDGLTFGRSQTCTIIIGSKQFPNVSGEHARISVDPGGKIVIEDLNSKNGTLVNNRPVERHMLEQGDMIQLGHRGPCFAVVTPGQLSETISMPPVNSPRQADLGATTIRRLKKAIGAVDAEGVQEQIQERSRRTHILLGVIVLIGAVTMAGVFGYLANELQRQSEQSSQARAQLQAELSDDFETKQNQQQAVIDGERLRLKAETKRLEAELGSKQSELEEKIAAGESASRGELQSLRQALADTETRLRTTQVRLEKFKPIDLEKQSQEKREKLKQIRRAVVFLECEFQFREVDSGKIMYISADDDGKVHLTLDKSGIPFTTDGFGSGFCISKDGWIITNAHVVHPKDADDRVKVRDWVLEPTLASLKVVFTDSSKRHDSLVVKLAESGSEDLALVKLEPFDDMPHIEGFDVGRELPPAGSPVYVFGFPLGSHALQDRDVRASTFSGIVSRTVQHYFQVDAAIYPGNSGGPVSDEKGNVIGVASATQTLPDSEDLANSMGYAIPVQAVAKIWPPPSK